MSASSKVHVLTAEEIRQRKFLKRGLFLNILVLGQTGTGKATFINTLCDEDIVATNRAAPSELNIEQHTAKIYEGGTQINLDITMIPGFGDFIDNKRATSVVIKHIETQFDNMLDEECKIQRSKKSRDSRIHAALYFIRPTGKGLRELDIHCLKLLSGRCNVIPIISKADLMTADECRLNKRLILRDIRNHGIKIYDFTMCFEDLEDEFFPGRLSEIVPFAVVSGTDRMIIDKEEFKVRKLPHGVVRVDDPTHNDFLILRTCLLGASLQDLKETTHI
ncbi:unnamed protein product [Ambrosiozyma monospora]|uniref:Unnamed protein product n=1 Tax=Ambrosiozyma monospora TaxID=43982 RepID=A0A9W6YTM7_AMBMO|nr:unnamed protein product [Ambrosiozyma monospora]